MRGRRSRSGRVARVIWRRLARRLDRASPDWVRWAPSWGTSLALHGLILLALAWVVLAGGDDGRAPRMIDARLNASLMEDVDSLVPAERAGDPFAGATGDEVPSLSLAPEPAPGVISQPELPGTVRFAPDLAGPALPIAPDFNGPLVATPAAKGGRRASGAAPRLALHSEDLTAPFSGRGGPAKAELVRREGGTVRSEAAVVRGLDWIARHQRADGGWSLDYHGQCAGEGCPPEQPTQSDTGATGLAILPMLGAGHSPTAKGPHQVALRRGLDWLIERQRPDGDLFIGGGSSAHFYSHAIAAFALCEAYGVTGDEQYRDPARKAIGFIVRTQNPSDGGWRYNLGQPGDTSVFGWNLLAMRSARLAGLDIPKSTLRLGTRYLDLASADDRGSTYSYLPGRPGSPVMTAEALLCRQYLGWPRDHPPLVKGTALVAADLQRSTDRNIYYWYYATQLLHNQQGKSWAAWNTKVRDGLVSIQVGSAGCDRGSWSPKVPQPDLWGRVAGRLYTTSLSLLTLEVYYRYLPLYRDPGGPSPDMAKAKAKAVGPPPASQ